MVTGVTRAPHRRPVSVRGVSGRWRPGGRHRRGRPAAGTSGPGRPPSAVAAPQCRRHAPAGAACPPAPARGPGPAETAEPGHSRIAPANTRAHRPGAGRSPGPGILLMKSIYPVASPVTHACADRPLPVRHQAERHPHPAPRRQAAGPVARAAFTAGRRTQRHQPGEAAVIANGRTSRREPAGVPRRHPPRRPSRDGAGADRGGGAGGAADHLVRPAAGRCPGGEPPGHAFAAYQEFAATRRRRGWPRHCRQRLPGCSPRRPGW